MDTSNSKNTRSYKDKKTPGTKKISGSGTVSVEQIIREAEAKTIDLLKELAPKPKFDQLTAFNPVHFVKMGLKVPYDKISAEGWMEIIMWVFQIYKPYLDYFPFIHDLEKPLSGGDNGLWGKEFYLGDKVASGNIGPHLPRARFIPLTSLFLQSNNHLSYLSEEKWKNNKLEEKFLLITPEGKWICLLRILSKFGETSIGEKSVCSYDYNLLKGKELQLLVESNRWIGPAVIQAFGRLASISIATKEMHLAHLKKARSLLSYKMIPK